MDKNNKIFEIASNRMYSALNAFFIWKIINQSINIHQEGGEEKAKENLDWVINKYKCFFQSVIINSYKAFVSDLAIFFDSEKYDESFSLGKLIMLATKEDKNISSSLKSEIEKIKNPHGKTISLVLKLRNQDVSHQALGPKQYRLVYKDIENLFEAVQEILSLLTKYYDRSFSVWNHVEGDMNRDIRWIYENLERGEKQRLRER